LIYIDSVSSPTERNVRKGLKYMQKISARV